MTEPTPAAGPAGPASDVDAEGVRCRRVLMVLFLFPPVGGVAMSRNVRNARHLPRHGWRPTVLTAADAANGALCDEDAMRLVPPTLAVIRTGSFDAAHVRALALRVGRLLHIHRLARLRRPRRSASIAAAAAPSTDIDTARRRSPQARVRQLVFFPDDHVGWLPWAVVAAVRAHRETPFDAIYTTSSPITAHLVGGLLKRLLGRPWVAEFRDPWVGNVLAAPLPRVHGWLRARLEARIVRSADTVVCVTPTLTRMYQRRYPGARVVTVPNGYDREEALPRREPTAGSRPYRVVYTGTLDRPAELLTFLTGVERLTERIPDLGGRLEISFYGLVSEDCRAIADRFLDGSLGGVVRIHGFVPRRDALAALADSDAGLVLLGPGPGMELFVGGKLYDYIGQDLPILAMLPPGDARTVLGELGWGVIADPEPGAVADAIERLMATPRPTGPADPDRRYDREVLAGRLAAELDALTADPIRPS